MTGQVLRERDAETGALDRALDALVAGSSPFVAVTGQPGTGRTSLLRRAAERAAARGVRVLSTRALPDESGYPLGVTRDLAGRLDGAQALRGIDGTGPAVLHGWCRVVHDAARAAPVLVVVDDVHRADDASVQWLRMMLRRRHSAPVGLMVSVNGTHDDADWAVAAAGPSDVVLRTGALSADAVRAVVVDSYGRLPERAFAVLARRATGGNPAVLVAALGRLDPDEPPSARLVPTLLRCAADARRVQVVSVLDGLPARLVDALRAVAVCGADIWPVAERIGGPGGCARTLARLVATGLVRVVPDPDRPVPADELVADVVLAGLEPGTRRALFATAAGLAVRSGLPDEDVARALLPAPVLGEAWAAELLRRVAARHRAAHRHDEAAAVAARALTEPVPERLRGPLLVDFALARARRGPRAAHRVLARAATGSDTAGGPHGVRAVDMLLADGDVAAARRALDVALRRSPPDDPARDDLLALSRLCDDLGFEQRTMPRERTGAGTGPDDRSVPSPASRGSAAWALTVRGRDREKAVRLARGVLAPPDGDEPVMPRVMAAFTLETAGHPEEAAAALRELLMEIAQQRYVPPAVLALTALVCLRRGDREAARLDLRAAGAAAAPPAAAAPLVEAVQVLLHLEDGDRIAAAATAFAHTAIGRDRPGSALLEYARGRVRLGEYRITEARELFMRCGRLLLDRGRVNPAMMPWRSAAATALLACGEHAAARRMAADEHRLAVQWGAPGPLAVADGALRSLGEPAEPVGVARAARP
ncbi:ATP-binding protein [Pseudonocardia endophytica]|uniref:AAA ATPase-like protein n=1 Tax=Pseudonocardia endophytica TaxID=401976 RepID=A0A4R1HPL6_PSEEN|nr:ATP-binding protein [Pseudonocardia endophytica]TCK24494.1 AAA ATPase-like protein [Pseudonocardia endophytica]